MDKEIQIVIQKPKRSRSPYINGKQSHIETRSSKFHRLNSIIVSETDLTSINFKQEAIKMEFKNSKKVTKHNKDKSTIDNSGKPMTILKTELCNTPNHKFNSTIDTLNMKFLIRSFNGDQPNIFFAHCRSFMTTSVTNAVESSTIEQAKSPLWHQMRFGRITASRIHQASRCITKNGSLVESIMGKRSGWSFAMQRGTDLEDKVFEVLKREMVSHNLRKCGLYFDSFFPNMAASPDGIADSFVLEIKCPASSKTYGEYICVDTLQRKYYGQIQLQMHITKRQRALLAVADLNFERNKKVAKVWIDYDEQYVNKLIEDANAFWIEAIYPILKRQRISSH